MTVPSGLTGAAIEAWERAIATLPEGRTLSRLEELTLERACRSFARWRALELQIDELRSKSPLAAELSRSAQGGMQVSALRSSADQAWADYAQLIADLDLGSTAARGPAAGDVDLFGDPVRRKDGKRGRPPHRPSQKSRDKVTILLAMGWSTERIANAIHCSAPTLRRYYRPELKARDRHRDRMNAWQVEMAVEAMKGGNVAAMRLFDRLIEKNDALVASRHLTRDEDDERAEPKGKKEAAREAARKAAEETSDPLWGSDLKPGFQH